MGDVATKLRKGEGRGRGREEEGGGKREGEGRERGREGEGGGKVGERVVVYLSYEQH